MTKSEHSLKGAGFYRFLTALLFLGVILSNTPPLFAKTEEPTRIVSINLCTDQFLLSLADSSQILALSPFARDATMSFYAEQAKNHARIKDDAESVIQLKPDLVLASIFNKSNTIKLIRRQGIKVLVLGYAGTLHEIADQHQIVADAIGHTDRGAKRKSAFLDLIAKSKSAYAQTPLSALYYHRGGYASGQSSLTGLLLHHTGLKNQAERYGIASYGNLSLENIIINPPDIFIVGESTRSKEDQGHRLLQHPALLKAMSGKHIMKFPVSETVCPGPSTASALTRLIKFQENLK